MKQQGKTGDRQPISEVELHGKIQPQAVDFEEAVLGAIMLEPQAMTDAVSIIKTPDIFYKDAHRKIFAACQQLFHENKPVDIITVTAKLKENGDLEICGGAYYITVLTDRVTSSANMEYHIAIIYQKYLRREMIRLSTQLIRESFNDEDDVFESIDSHMLEVMNLYNTINFSNVEQVGDIARENMDTIKKATEHSLIGTESGFRNIDYITKGFQNGDLIVVAGRPGMGKTAFGVSLIYNMSVKHNIPCGFISLEMTKSQVVMRLQAIMVGMPYQSIRGGGLDSDQIARMEKDIKVLVDTKAYIDDTPSLSIIQLRAKVMDMVKSYGVKVIMVDYLQLMTAGQSKYGQNREQEISSISRGLKALAKDLNIPVIAFAQLSRKVEERPGKRPVLSDLRESGAIEQDADIVMFLYRPEYYDIPQDEEGNSTENVGMVLIEKHRNGSTGEVKLTFDKSIMRYRNFDYDTPEPPLENYSQAKFIKEDLMPF